MKKVDCLGDICPVPIIKTKKELRKTKSGQSIMIVTDHSCTIEALADLFKHYNVKYETEEVINGVWEVTVTKL